MSRGATDDGYRAESFGVVAGPTFSTPLIDLKLERGEAGAVIGASGTGKTLLFEYLAGVRRPSMRSVGRATKARVELIPQDPRLSVLPTDRVWTLLGINPWWLRLKRLTGYRPNPSTAEQRAVESMEELGLDPLRLLELPVRALSASERVRVLLCATLLSHPEVLLIDGWNETIDATDRKLMMSVLKERMAQGLIVITSARAYPLNDWDVDRVVDWGRDQDHDQAPVPLVVRAASQAPQKHPILDVERLVVTQGASRLHPRQPRASIVDGASLFVRHGEIVALLGPAGSGKSTLLAAIAGLSSPRSGSIRVAGRDVTYARGRKRTRLRRDVQLVFQDAAAVLESRRSVGSHLEEARTLAGTKVASSEEWLEKLGLSSRLLTLPADQLSASESQRVDLARSLILSPKLVLLDGPEVGGIDTDGGMMASLIRAEKRSGRAFLIATSHPETALALADRVFVLHAGRIIEMGSKSLVLDTPAHPVTEALMAQAPLPASDPTSPPRGCAYVGHCERRNLPLCKEKEPMLAPLSSALDSHSQGVRRVACFVPIIGDKPVQFSAPAYPPETGTPTDSE